MKRAAFRDIHEIINLKPVRNPLERDGDSSRVSEAIALLTQAYAASWRSANNAVNRRDC